MRSIQVWAAAAATLLLLAGCTREMKTAVASGEGEVPFRAGSDVSMNYDYSIEYITGGVPEEVQDRINRRIISEEIFYEGDVTGVDVPMACSQWEEKIIAGYKSDAEDLAGEFDADEDSWMFNWEFSMSGAFTSSCKARNLQTYSCIDQQYTGGAHGMFAQTCWVFDMTTGELVELDDLFVKDFEEDEGVSDLLCERILELIDDEYGADALFGPPYPNANFSVDEEGVTWLYNPYEIAPYAMGVLEAKLTWEELKPYLKN